MRQESMTRSGTLSRMAALGAILALAACASAPPGADFAAADPHEDTNRSIHEFNVGLDTAVLQPLAQGYDLVTPDLLQLLLGNGFSHLDLPGIFVNQLLQGEGELALDTLGRFTINTLIGAGGLLDPATEFGLPKRETDFGITLAKSGAGEGSYLVLPLFGPSTGRDVVGRVVDIALQPTTYLGLLDPSLDMTVSAAVMAAETVDARDRNKAVIDDVLYGSEDSYVTLRSVYLQRRRAMVAGEEGGAEALPDIFNSN